MKIIAITPDKKMNTLATLVVDGMNELGIDVIATDTGNNVRKVYTDDEVIEHSRDADYVMVLFGKHKHNNPNKTYLLDRINRPEITAYVTDSEWTCTSYTDSKTQVKECLTDMSRHRGNPWIDEEMYDKCRWYFKRIVFEEDLEREKIIPCYIGAWDEYFQLDGVHWTKEYDYYCSFGGHAGHTNNGLRAPVYEYLLTHSKNPDLKTLVGQRFGYQQYLENINKSFIGISAWGAGNCCRRMWEILSNKTCCFIQKPFIIYPHKFVDGVSCVYYSNMDEFKEKLDYYIKNKDEAVRIGLEGYNHVKRHHTGRKRVEYMLNVMKGVPWQQA
jgi:hypothetical protein